MGILPSRHLDVRMTSYKNFIVDFGFRIQKYPPPPFTKLEQDQANILENRLPNIFDDSDSRINSLSDDI